MEETAEKHKTLEEKREEMIGFLLENIVAKSIERKNNDIIFTDGKGIKYFIKTISRQSDFQYDFVEDPKSFDNDRLRLKRINGKVALFLELKSGYVPGFVFLQADTDYSQLDERTQNIVNNGSFLKQKLPTKSEPKPHFDRRVLDPLEIVIQQFYRTSDSRRGKTKMRENRTYSPELYYFNPKEQRIDVVWFSDVKDTNHFKRVNCPMCNKPNGYDHTACREDQDYWRYAKARDEARYEKGIWVVKRRREIASRSQTEAEHGIVFEPTTVNGSYLGLVGRKLNLAVIQ